MDCRLALSLFLSVVLTTIIHADTKGVEVVEGPIVLHANIAGQWGGHTFCYLLQGKRAVFWSATAYPEQQPPTVLVGQYPTLGSRLEPTVSSLQFTAADVKGSNQPQMLRTPDGHLHVFIGVTHTTDNPNFSPGRLHYFRSKLPEDISILMDRTELLPTEIYDSFHLRMNVGLSPDGHRMVLVVLAISEDGSIPFNTPVVFVGERQGLDFVFQPPIRYAEPMSLFYPQLAATNNGIIIVGQVWDNSARVTTRLLHLDWQGKLVHREDLPAVGDGNFLSLDLRSISANDCSQLMIYYNRLPADHQVCHHEFWQYDVEMQQLRLLRSLETEYGLANYGKWLPVSDGFSAFINNPSMSALHVWQGDLLGGEEVSGTPLIGANPLRLGYLATAYLFAPNALQGSVVSQRESYIASDCFNPGKEPESSGPCSFLLWRLDLDRNPHLTPDGR